MHRNFHLRSTLVKNNHKNNYNLQNLKYIHFDYQKIKSNHFSNKYNEIGAIQCKPKDSTTYGSCYYFGTYCVTNH